jgi:hypothetical protein
MYVVYLVKYNGEKLPPYYVGSTNLKKLKNGYRGSVISKKYKKIFKEELKENPHLFDYEILSEHKTRKEALNFELDKQIDLDVVKSDEYFNESLASVDGMFGRDVSGELNPMYGKTHTDETRKKQSKKRGNKKRYVVTDEHRKIFSKTHKNKIVSKETRLKISEAKKGQNIGELNPMFGKTHTDEVKLKISKANKGYVPSEETRLKISKANKGYVPSEETRLKISKSLKGRKRAKFSEEWKKKISEANKGRKMSKESKDKLIATKTGMKYKESVCPHCNKIGRGGNMKRYHFENCKLNLDKS